MKKFFCSFFLLYFCFLFSEIFEIQNIREMEKYISDDCLVLFDLDNTLIEPVQELGSPQWFDSRINIDISKGYEPKQALIKTYDDWLKIQVMTEVKTVEKDTKEIFDKINKSKKY